MGGEFLDEPFVVAEGLGVVALAHAPVGVGGAEPDEAVGRGVVGVDDAGGNAEGVVAAVLGDVGFEDEGVVVPLCYSKTRGESQVNTWPRRIL